MRIITILNEFTLRQMTSLRIREVVSPSRWTKDQVEIYISYTSNLVEFILINTTSKSTINVYTLPFVNLTAASFKLRL